MRGQSKDAIVGDPSTADSTYFIGSHDWPIGTASGVTIEQMYAVIARFDDFYESAVRGLASTEVPADTRPPA